MSERLYYEDAYTTRFKASVTERVSQKGRLAIVLDRTYFYPTSGGQPHDQGWLDGAPVVDVTIRAEDGALLHWLDGREPDSDRVTAEIDWARRFGHMQHHTGQHILSQAFLRIAQAETVGFHLSDNSVTIDLDGGNLSPDQVEQVELLANDIVWQNRPVYIRMVTPAQAQKLPLRKIPPARNGRLRLIDIEDFDLTACGGTHVAATGSVGMIKVVRLERRGDQLRIEFCCGRRALHDYGQKNEIVNQLTAELTTGATDVAAAVNRLRAEAKEARRVAKKQQAALLHYAAADLWQKRRRHNGVNVISNVLSDSDPAQLRALANQLIENGDTIALLALAGPKAQLVFCRSAGAPGKMDQLLKVALAALGEGSGGGSATLAQGGGIAAGMEQLQQALAQAEKALAEEIE